MHEITFIRDSTPDGKPIFNNGVVRFYMESDHNIFIGVWGNGWITECQGIDKDTLNILTLDKTNPWINKTIKIKAEIITPIFVKIPIPDDDCPICLEKLSNKHCSTMSKCNHIFHKNCIIIWSRQNNSCPYCRTEGNSLIDIKDGGNKDIY